MCNSNKRHVKGDAEIGHGNSISRQWISELAKKYSRRVNGGGKKEEKELIQYMYTGFNKQVKCNANKGHANPAFQLVSLEELAEKRVREKGGGKRGKIKSYLNAYVQAIRGT